MSVDSGYRRIEKYGVRPTREVTTILKRVKREVDFKRREKKKRFTGGGLKGLTQLSLNV